jgi:hypothetical protein
MKVGRRRKTKSPDLYYKNTGPYRLKNTLAGHTAKWVVIFEFHHKRMVKPQKLMRKKEIAVWKEPLLRAPVMKG